MEKKYTKVYTRENSLFAIEVWEEHQGHRIEKYLGDNAPVSIIDVHGGVAIVYYDKDIDSIWHSRIENTANSNPEVIENLMNLYEKQIERMEKIWKAGSLNSKVELVEFFDFMSDMWIGVSVSYGLPGTKNIDNKYQELGMKLRTRSVDFLDKSDRVIVATLEKIFPELGNLVKYISINELREENVLSKKVLEERKKHYVYFNFKILTNVDARKLAAENGIQIVEEEVPEGIKELKGQVAMRGKVTGRVRVLHNKSEISTLLDGEILVTAMTTPDYLPAMNKAAAFITDEGGITCHAAIVAREMKKPCIIGTKIATKGLKDGYMIEVDAEKGIVTILGT